MTRRVFSEAVECLAFVIVMFLVLLVLSLDGVR